MVKPFCKTLVIALTVYCGAHLLETKALAVNSSVSEQPTAPPDSTVVEQMSSQPVAQVQKNILAPHSSKQTTQMAQVTSVSELTDVQPTDWAFGALQSLVERYGCIEGYPNSTYRGNRAMSRYEFAAGLNKCLDRINELIAAQQSQGVSKEDLVTLERLQKDFTAELKNLRGRVDALEANIGTLENQQFSTTTKLSGGALLILANPFGEKISDVNNTTLGYRVNLGFITSFTGKDSLTIALQGTNLRTFNTATEFPESRLSGSTDEVRLLSSSASGNGDLQLAALQYRFPMSDKLTVSLDIYSSDRILSAIISPFANGSIGPISGYGQLNPMLYPVGQQAGVGLQWKLTPWWNLDFSLGTEGPTNDPSVDVFKRGYGASVRSSINIGRFKLAASYINSYSPESGVDTASGSNAAKVIGAGPVVASTYVVGAFYRFNPRFELGGSVGYTNARALGDGTKGDAEVLDYRINLVFYDFLKKGNFAGLILGTQPRLTSTSNDALAQAIGLPLGQRSDRDIGYHIEAFYTYRHTDNIATTAGLFWLTAPNHDERNPDVVVGAVKTSFSF